MGCMGATGGAGAEGSALAGAFAAPFVCDCACGCGCGVVRAGNAPGASVGGAFVVVASVHAFGFLRRATPSGGFGVTSARHQERAAKTPWYLTNGK